MKRIVRDNFRIVATPKALGDCGYFTIPDERMSRDPESDYLDRCRQIARIVEALPDVAGASVRFDTRELCSHCELDWSPMTAQQATDPKCLYDEHSIEGEPACCEKAINEFRAEHGLPLVDE